MRLLQPRQLFAALLLPLTFTQIRAVSINTNSTDLTSLQSRATTPPPGGQVTPPGQMGGSPESNPSPVSAPMKYGQRTSYQVSNQLINWMKSKGEKGWRHIPAETGGCEGWIQVEFTNYMKDKYGISAGRGNIREQRVYKTTTQAADFTFPPDIDRKGTTRTRGMIVELKVESSSGKGTKLAKLVEQDKKKFTDGVAKEYKDYDKMILAIAWTPFTKEELRKVGMVKSKMQS